jgi:hypothetical protein
MTVSPSLGQRVPDCSINCEFSNVTPSLSLSPLGEATIYRLSKACRLPQGLEGRKALVLDDILPVAWPLADLLLRVVGRELIRRSGFARNQPKESDRI